MDSSEVIAALEAANAMTEVPLLLASDKIDANAILGYRGTPLTVALRDANLPLARLLLEHGADPWAANLDDPPLIVAARYCLPDAIDELLAQPHASTDDEQVPGLRDRALYAAAPWCRSAVINSLLSHGASPNSLPYTPKDFDPSAPPQVKDVNVPAAPMNPQLNYAEQAKWGSGTALHVVARATPHSLRLWDKLRGRKPLWTEQDQIDCIKAMIRCGADGSLRDEMGRTALEVAQAANAGKAVVQVLWKGMKGISEDQS